MMQPVHWQLLAALADGQRQHVFALAQQLAVKPQQLNSLWQRMPTHIRGLLRQQDGQWRLVRPLAILDECGLAQAAQGFQTELWHECASSNDVLLAKAKQQPDAVHRCLCWVHEQTQGRGRQGRSWHSRMGECLTFSVAWTFEQTQAELSALALVVALACQQALVGLGVPVQIKWSNDLVVGRDKLGGILIETVRTGGKTVAVMGIGLNFVLPKEVPQATSIQAIAPHALTVSQVLAAILQSLAALLTQFAEHGFAALLADYEVAHRDQGRYVRLLQGDAVVQEGEVLGVTAQGALRLQTEAGEKHVVSGEVSLRPCDVLPDWHQVKSVRYLLLDGGNSQLKWAWVDKGVMGTVSRSPYRDLSQLGREWEKWGSDDCLIVGSAVCGEEKKQLVAAQLPMPITWLASMEQGLGIRNHYRNPAEHGADRWFNALGSRRFTQHACVVVSCGTAVTIDALTDDNHYLGGTIMPGFHLMKEAMAIRTANLNRPLGRVYAFPTTTPNALASGMMDAVCGSVMLMHKRLQERVGTDKPVDIVLTGGGAARVAEALGQLFDLDNTVKIIDNLVLYGLLNWVEQE